MSRYIPTRHPNLVRDKLSGTFFLRARINGTPKRVSLKTKALSVALLRLADRLKDLRKIGKRKASGSMTFKEAAGLFLEQQRALVKRQQIKPRHLEYREYTLKTIYETWDGLESMEAHRITASDCAAWAGRHGARFAGSTHNGAIGTLQLVLNVAVKAGMAAFNPAKELTRASIRPRRLQLPSQEAFLQVVAVLDKGEKEHVGQHRPGTSFLVQFLAASGLRVGEARRVKACDVNFIRNELHVLGDTVTGTKNWSVRTIPMISDLRELLLRYWEMKKPSPDDLLVPVQNVRNSLKSACEACGITPLTHHDLRHLFATRCIEAGVDIPTVALWLGHRDKGVLAMKTYGHIRNDHSKRMAEMVGRKVSTSEEKTA